LMGFKRYNIEVHVHCGDLANLGCSSSKVPLLDTPDSRKMSPALFHT
jgi:hypothetical protein